MRFFFGCSVHHGWHEMSWRMQVWYAIKLPWSWNCRLFQFCFGVLNVSEAVSCVRVGEWLGCGQVVQGSISGNTERYFCWLERYQLDVTCFIVSLFTAQHVSDVNTSIIRSLRLIWWVISWVVLIWFDVCWCYVVVWLGWCGIRMQASACIRIPHHPTIQTMK